MQTRRALLMAAGGLLAAALPVGAHHSFSAEYDGSKPITLKGKVTLVEWINPHSWIHLDVTGEDGKVANWSCETAPPNGLYRQGWRRNSIKEGDEVVIEGFVAKDGSHTMTARTVQTPDGRKLFAGSATDGGPQAQKPNDK
jgi:hypothetical protein